MTESVFGRVIVPVASESDARTTCKALLPHLRRVNGEAHIVHVIEQNPGYIDHASIEQRKQRADRIFAAATEVCTDESVTVETHLRYEPDVATAIHDTCDELDVTAIVFVTRKASRWKRALTGDVALNLITNNACPTIVLPEPSSNQQTKLDWLRSALRKGPFTGWLSRDLPFLSGE